MSIGNQAERPNISEKGVTPVVSCTLVLYASISIGSRKSQSLQFFSRAVLSMFRRVLLNLSIILSDWGWYGLVHIFLISRSLQISLIIISASKLRPWSVCKCSGIPKRQMNSCTKMWATVVASMFFIGYAFFHLVYITMLEARSMHYIESVIFLTSELLGLQDPESCVATWGSCGRFWQWICDRTSRGGSDAHPRPVQVALS